MEDKAFAAEKLLEFEAGLKEDPNKLLLLLRLLVFPKGMLGRLDAADECEFFEGLFRLSGDPVVSEHRSVTTVS